MFNSNYNPTVGGIGIGGLAKDEYNTLRIESSSKSPWFVSSNIFFASLRFLLSLINLLNNPATTPMVNMADPTMITPLVCHAADFSSTWVVAGGAAAAAFNVAATVFVACAIVACGLKLLSTFVQSLPEKPGWQKHCALWHLPRPLHPFGQGIFLLHAVPLNPGLQSHTPFFRQTPFSSHPFPHSFLLAISIIAPD